MVYFTCGFVYLCSFFNFEFIFVNASYIFGPLGLHKHVNLFKYKIYLNLGLRASVVDMLQYVVAYGLKGDRIAECWSSFNVDN